MWNRSEATERTAGFLISSIKNSRTHKSAWIPADGQEIENDKTTKEKFDSEVRMQNVNGSFTLYINIFFFHSQ